MPSTDTPNRPSADDIRTATVVEAKESVDSASMAPQTRAALVVQIPLGKANSVRVHYNVERHRRRIENLEYNRPQSLSEVED